CTTERSSASAHLRYAELRVGHEAQHRTPNGGAESPKLDTPPGQQPLSVPPAAAGSGRTHVGLLDDRLDDVSRDVLLGLAAVRAVVGHVDGGRLAWTPGG